MICGALRKVGYHHKRGSITFKGSFDILQHHPDGSCGIT
jgi:hypothetical protein